MVYIHPIDTFNKTYMPQLTPEELNELRTVVSQFEQAVFNTGQITLDIEALKSERRTFLEQSEKALNARIELQKRLEVKYGKGKLNIETGDITNE
jgi:hypothetical protein